MNRRIFNKKILETVASFALIDTLFAYDAIGKPIKPITDHWALQLHEFCADLGVAAISPLQWQQKIEELYAKVELSELLEFINFHNLIKGFKYPDLGVATKSVSFPRLNELPERTAFVKKIFGMKKDRTIIPHGHSNMASAHMVLSGEMHLRHYEKVQQDNQHYSTDCRSHGTTWRKFFHL